LSKEILCTLGPASMNGRVIGRLTELGATLFRINLSHTALADVGDVIDTIRSHTDVPICLDTEGAQVRTGAFVEGKILIAENEIIQIPHSRAPGNARCFNLYPSNIVGDLEIGDFISIDFNAVLVQVTEARGGGVAVRVLNGGEIGSNKAVTVERALTMPPLTEKDIAALKIGRAKGIDHVALSFANFPEDVDVIRRHAGDGVKVISKIECRNGVENLEEIATRSDAILIDRGDLSREFPVEHIPAMQKQITRRTKAVQRKVYVATNLLESMIVAPVPTRAEVNDVYNTLMDGVDGLVLAAETAIGAYPISCASMIVKLIHSFEAGSAVTPDYYVADPASLLVEPHGGKLVHREALAMAAEADQLPRVRVSDLALMDCQQIALGTFSPLTGFMDSAALESVLQSNHLPDGTIWTLPITLQLPREALKGAGVGDRVALESAAGIVHAMLDISEIYPLDFERIVQPWFGADSMSHPGVAGLAERGDVFVAGAVTLVRRLESLYRHFELTPAQTRFLFTRKGWSRVVGFHTRNVAHRVHEHIQLAALEETNADGLYISPVIGPRKTGDFLPGPILKSYQIMLDFHLYPVGKVVLGSFATYPRYSGPREAVFTALCRKNLGCSHFIVGRDHTGVGDFYRPEESQALFEKLGDMGVAPVFFDEIAYDSACGAYVPASEASEPVAISGSKARQMIAEDEALPEWFMRDIIQDHLRSEIAAGRAIISA
jgi:pyruvate kinase